MPTRVCEILIKILVLIETRVSRIEMLSNQIEKNAMDYGTGSAKKVHKDFMDKIDEAAKKITGASIEFSTEINKEAVSMMVTGFRMKSEIGSKRYQM